MNKETVRNIKVGIFMIAGVLLLVVGLYFIGSNRNMFGKTYRLYTMFPDVKGLQTGNNVRFDGIDIGTVESIKIINDTSIKIEMVIDGALKKVIRKNSLAAIGTDGLMGSKIINIEPGTPDGKLAEPGDELQSIKGVNMDQMLQTLELTNKNIAIVSANLRDITNNINTGRGTLYTVLMDTTLAVKIHSTLDNIELVSNNILKISTDLNTVTGKVKDGKGLLGTLVNDTVISSDLTQTIEEVRMAGARINESTGQLKQLLQKINSGNGTIATLLNDTATAYHIRQSLINIDNSSRNFNENMEALKHNFLLRPYFKKQEKKKQENKKP